MDTRVSLLAFPAARPRRANEPAVARAGRQADRAACDVDVDVDAELGGAGQACGCAQDPCREGLEDSTKEGIVARARVCG